MRASPPRRPAFPLPVRLTAPLRRGLFAALLATAFVGCSQQDRGPVETSAGVAAPTITEPGAAAPRVTDPKEAMSNAEPKSGDSPAPRDTGPTPAQAAEELATFGAGCFWCVEAVLEQLDGVIDVQSGYMGGDVANPSYEAVCTGTTGHAEVVQIRFDPSRIAYATLLDWFWKLHDPTTLNRQGADVGTQYRSAIFVHGEAQQRVAEESRTRHQADFARPIVTEITRASAFYAAELYHQDFYRGNRSYGYCRAVIVPKLDKLGLKR
jgi:peptide-methionine (S)-S-oxide reductase